MKNSLAFTAFVFCSIQIQAASADCLSIQKEIATTYAALTVAKDRYKGEAVIAMQQTSEQAIDAGITSNRRMKAAMDQTIDVLVRSKNEGCFGADEPKWTAAIAMFRQESNSVGETIKMLIDAKTRGRRPN
jgi:hypothetical protein